jgi:hypothetical protein
MLFDRLLRFLEAGESGAIDLPSPYKASFLDLPADCILFQRNCNIDEMTCEDDEQYVFTTPDEKYSAKFNRFQVRIILKRFGPLFDDEKIDRIIRYAWNFPRVVINKKTAQYTLFSKSNDGLPPLPELSGPSIKTIYT